MNHPPAHLEGPVPEDVLVVVAHPDDEILWLSPVVGHAAVIVAALPVQPTNAALSQARELLREQYPVERFEYLPLQGSAVFHHSDWLRRRPVDYGVTLGPSCPPERAQAYRGNYPALLAALEPYVREHHEIFTHNPWGEYGHEEHVQVSNAVVHLAQRHGASVWSWDGFSPRQLLAYEMRLRNDYFRRGTRSLPRLRLRNDIALYANVKRLYQDHEAWTWDPGYELPTMADYIQLVRAGERLLRPRPRPPAGQAGRIFARKVRSRVAGTEKALWPK